jgi:hypothetical protein
MSPHYGRRDFIRLGGLGVVLGSMASGRSARARGARPEAGVPRTIAAGYWLGSEERTDPGSWSLAGDETTLVSALAIPPDPELEGGAAVTVHGLVEAAPAWHSPALQSLSLTARYALPDLPDSDDGIDFQAWSYARGPVTNDGSPIRFEIPTGPGVDLRLTLEREAERPGLGRRALDAALTGVGIDASPLPARAHLRLTSDRTPGTPKLRRGVYVIAVGDRPAWARFAWADHSFPPTELDHLVISIDRPGA